MKASTRTGPSPVMIPSPSGVAPAGMRFGVVRSVMASLYPVAPAGLAIQRPRLIKALWLPIPLSVIAASAALI